MKYCNLCAAVLTLEHFGKADLIRTGGYADLSECQRCGKRRMIIDYKIMPRPAPEDLAEKE